MKFLLLILVAFNVGQAEPVPVSDVDEASFFVPRPDGVDEAVLEIDSLTQKGRYTEALALLRSLPRKFSEAILKSRYDETLYVPIGIYVLQRTKDIPVEHLKDFRASEDSLAKEKLGQYRLTKNLEIVFDILRAHPLSTFAPDAINLLAEHHFEHGRVSIAGFLWNQLLETVTDLDRQRDYLTRLAYVQIYYQKTLELDRTVQRLRDISGESSSHGLQRLLLLKNAGVAELNERSRGEEQVEPNSATWRYDWISPGRRQNAKPLVVNGRVFVSDNHGLHVFDSSGAVVFSHEFEEVAGPGSDDVSRPGVGQEKVCVKINRSFRCFDFKGDILWTTSELVHDESDRLFWESLEYVSSPVFEGRNILFTAISRSAETEAVLCALDASTGKIDWRTNLVASKVERYLGLGDRPSSPVVSDGLAIVTTNLGTINAISTDEGRPVWARSYERFSNGIIPKSIRYSRRWKYSDSLINNGTTYVVPQDSIWLYAIDIISGKVDWKYQDVELDRLDAANASTVLLSSASKVTALDLSTGTQMWSRHINDKLTGSGILSSGIALWPTVNGISRFDVSSGERLTDIEMGVPCFSVFDVHGASVGVLTRNSLEIIKLGAGESFISAAGNSEVLGFLDTTSTFLERTSERNPWNAVNKLLEISRAHEKYGSEIVLRALSQLLLDHGHEYVKQSGIEVPVEIYAASGIKFLLRHLNGKSLEKYTRFMKAAFSRRLTDTEYRYYVSMAGDNPVLLKQALNNLLADEEILASDQRMTRWNIIEAAAKDIPEMKSIIGSSVSVAGNPSRFPGWVTRNGNEARRWYQKNPIDTSKATPIAMTDGVLYVAFQKTLFGSGVFLGGFSRSYTELTAFGANTGRRIWKSVLPSGVRTDEHLIDLDVGILVIGGTELRLIDAVTGGAKWSYKVLDPVGTGLAEKIRQWEIKDNRLVVLTSVGKLASLSLESGNMIWERAVKQSESKLVKTLSGNVIVLSENPLSMSVFDADDGGQVFWKGIDIPQRALKGSAQSVGEDRLLLTLDGTDQAMREIVGLSKSGGEVLWKTPVGFPVGGLLVSGENNVVIYPLGWSRSGQIIGLETVDGKAKWTFDLQGMQCRHVSLLDKIYVLGLKDLSRTLIAIDPVDGKEVWRTQVESGFGKSRIFTIGDLIGVIGTTSATAELLESSSGKIVGAFSLEGRSFLDVKATSDELYVCTEREIYQLSNSPEEEVEYQNQGITNYLWELGNAHRRRNRLEAFYSTFDSERKESGWRVTGTMLEESQSLKEGAAIDGKMRIAIPRAIRAPQVDGSTADEWPRGARHELRSAYNISVIENSYESATEEIWRGENDLSGDLFLAWDDDNLYITVDVRDDVSHSFSSESPVWKGDGLMIAIDPDSDGGFGYNGRDYVFTQALMQKKPDKEENEQEGEENDPDGQYSVRRNNDGTGTVYEAAVPWKYIKRVPGKSGSKFGLNIFVTDDDTGGGARKGLTLTPGISLHQKRSLFSKGYSPEYFAEITLTE